MSEKERLKQIIYYKTIDGRCPYDEWFNSLDNKTKSIIDNRIERLIGGLYGDHKKLSNSLLSELRFFVGKGYRVYYKDLTNFVIIIVAGKVIKNELLNKLKNISKTLLKGTQNDRFCRRI